MYAFRKAFLSHFQQVLERDPGCGKAAGGGTWNTRLAPLILSFSPWEKGRLNSAQSVQHRPLSQGERDRVRGVAAR
jgi:hypothetical protein